MKFAQILNNKVHWVFDTDSTPRFAPNIILKDITNVNPQPQEGWDYNSIADSYTPPIIITQQIQVPIPNIKDVITGQQVIKDGMADLFITIASIPGVVV